MTKQISFRQQSGNLVEVSSDNGIPIAGYDPVNEVNMVAVTNPDHLQQSPVITQIGASQTLTGSFADLGGEIATATYRYLYLFLTIDINDSQNVRLRVLGKHTAVAADEYIYPHQDLVCADTSVSTTEDYIEFDTDADQLKIVKIPLENALAFVQLQVMAGTVGASAGAITAAYYTLGY